MKIPPLPDEVIDTLLQLSLESDSLQWQLGDVLADLMDEIGPYYSSVLGGDRQAHAWLIKHIATRTGLARSTINDRENVSRFFPAIVRNELEPLSYHQIRALKSAGDEWRKYLEWVHEYAAEHNGSFPSVEHIRHEIAGSDDTPGWIRKIDKARDYLISASYDNPPIDISEAINDCLKCLERAEKAIAKDNPDMSGVQDTSGGGSTSYAYSQNEGRERIRR